MPFNVKLSGNVHKFSSSSSSEFLKNNPGVTSPSSIKNQSNGIGLMINSIDTMQNFREKLLQISGNEKCADCGCRDAKWASINLGVILKNFFRT